MADAPWPIEIKLAAARDRLIVAFDDGRRFELPAELLRVMSPSAEVQGHRADQRVTVAGKRRVKITDVRPVGNYAVQLIFDDGHSTGFYRWEYLYDLGARLEQHLAAYVAELAEKGFGRD